MEIPPAVKERLGFDLERSWVVVNEGNIFTGFDLRKVPETGRFEYGFLPPRFFNEVLAGFRSWRLKRKSQLIAR